MKKTIALMLVTLFCISTTSVFAGKEGGSGNGSGDKVLKWEIFPKETLTPIIDGLREKLKQGQNDPSVALSRLADAMLEELNALEKDWAFQYADVDLAILNTSSYKYLDDGPVRLDVVLGAMTHERRGAKIGFFRKTKKYGAEKFEQVLAHEIFHHVIPHRQLLVLKNSEMEALAQAVAEYFVSGKEMTKEQVSHIGTVMARNTLDRRLRNIEGWLNEVLFIKIGFSYRGDGYSAEEEAIKLADAWEDFIDNYEGEKIVEEYSSPVDLGYISLTPTYNMRYHKEAYEIEFVAGKIKHRSTLNDVSIRTPSDFPPRKLFDFIKEYRAFAKKALKVSGDHHKAIEIRNGTASPKEYLEILEHIDGIRWELIGEYPEYYSHVHAIRLCDGKTSCWDTSWGGDKKNPHRYISVSRGVVSGFRPGMSKDEVDDAIRLGLEILRAFPSTSWSPHHSPPVRVYEKISLEDFREVVRKIREICGKTKSGDSTRDFKSVVIKNKPGTDHVEFKNKGETIVVDIAVSQDELREKVREFLKIRKLISGK